MSREVSREVISNISAFVWSIAEILRGDFKQSEYGKVILPFVVLRRLDCLLEDTKEAVLAAADNLPEGLDDEARDMILFDAAGGHIRVYNTSRFTFKTSAGPGPAQLHQNLIDYITKFSPNVRDIFLEKFLFTDQLKRLKDGGILWHVFERFCQSTCTLTRCLHRDGLPVRGADPPLLRNLERDCRRAFHPARSHPSDCRPPARYRRCEADGARHHPQVYDPACGHRRHAGR